MNKVLFRFLGSLFVSFLYQIDRNRIDTESGYAIRYGAPAFLWVLPNRLYLVQRLLCYNLSSLNYLNDSRVSNGGVLNNYYLFSSSLFAATAFARFVASLVSATHCAKCNSSDKKNLLHIFNALNVTIPSYFGNRRQN